MFLKANVLVLIFDKYVSKGKDFLDKEEMNDLKFLPHHRKYSNRQEFCSKVFTKCKQKMYKNKFKLMGNTAKAVKQQYLLS